MIVDQDIPFLTPNDLAILPFDRVHNAMVPRRDGITVREPRPGGVQLQIPPMEQWRKLMRWVTPKQRTRIESPQSYRRIQEQVTAKFLAWKQEPS